MEYCRHLLVAAPPPPQEQEMQGMSERIYKILKKEDTEIKKQRVRQYVKTGGSGR